MNFSEECYLFDKIKRRRRTVLRSRVARRSPRIACKNFNGAKRVAVVGRSAAISCEPGYIVRGIVRWQAGSNAIPDPGVISALRMMYRQRCSGTPVDRKYRLRRGAVLFPDGGPLRLEDAFDTGTNCSVEHLFQALFPLPGNPSAFFPRLGRLCCVTGSKIRDSLPWIPWEITVSNGSSRGVDQRIRHKRSWYIRFLMSSIHLSSPEIFFGRQQKLFSRIMLNQIISFITYQMRTLRLPRLHRDQGNLFVILCDASLAALSRFRQTFHCASDP